VDKGRIRIVADRINVPELEPEHRLESLVDGVFVDLTVLIVIGDIRAVEPRIPLLGSACILIRLSVAIIVHTADAWAPIAVRITGRIFIGLTVIVVIDSDLARLNDATLQGQLLNVNLPVNRHRKPPQDYACHDEQPPQPHAGSCSPLSSSVIHDQISHCTMRSARFSGASCICRLRHRRKHSRHVRSERPSPERWNCGLGLAWQVRLRCRLMICLSGVLRRAA